MSTYRTSMMLYSSVLALSLVAASEGFCGSKSESANGAVKASTEKEKGGEVKAVKESGSKGKKAAVAKQIVAPLTDAEEDADEKIKREQIAKAQKKSQFAKKIVSIKLKYATLLSSISGERKEIIATELRAHSEKVTAALSEALSNPKSDVYEKLEEGMKRKNTFVQSKKESVGLEDAAWFDEVHTAARKQLKRLAKLNAEFEGNKGNAPEQEKTKIIYSDRINSFLASYDAFTACTHYLASAKEYCNDNAISFNSMKVQFPDFSSKAFKEAAVPADILSGKRDPFASTRGYKFYAIGKAEYQNGEFLSQIPAESDEAKLIATARKSEFQALLNPENGGLILSSKMMQKEGMDRPVCVFSSYAVEGGKETVYRFSLVHESEEAAGKQLTAQLIQAETQPERDKLVEAAAKLKVSFEKERNSGAGKKSAKKAKDKDGKAKEKVDKDGDKAEKKVAKADDKPKSKDRKSKEKVDKDGAKAEKKVAKSDDTAEKKVAKADDKPKTKDAKPKEKAAAKEGDDSVKKARNKEIEEAAGKPKATAKEAEKVTTGADDKPKAAESTEKAKATAKEAEKATTGAGDKSKAAESSEKPKADAKEAEKTTTGADDKPKAAESTDKPSKNKDSDKPKAEKADDSSKANDKKKTEEVVAGNNAEPPKEQAKGGFFSGLFGSSKGKDEAAKN